MKYTPRQLSFAQYLLRRIGFLRQKDIDVYLQHLLKVKGRYHFNPKAKNAFKSWQYSAKACIDTLMAEIKLKGSPTEIKTRKLNGKNWTATSLSRYAFCSAAFSIGHSFEPAAATSNEWIEIGECLHQSLRLGMRYNQRNADPDPFYQRGWQNPAITKMLRSKLVHVGHGEKLQLFQNEETGFSGSPDYIFQDRDGAYFVVEEKFIRQDDPMNPAALKLMREELAGTLEAKNLERYQLWEKLPFYFFENHIIQVLAYLYNLIEYPLSYGYLVYWLYDFKDGEPYVFKAGVKKIKLDEKSSDLYQQYKLKMGKFMQKGVEAFDAALVNPKKCAACSFSPFCMQKTRRLDRVWLPYPSDALRLFPSEFPDALRPNHGHQI